VIISSCIGRTVVCLGGRRTPQTVPSHPAEVAGGEVAVLEAGDVASGEVGADRTNVVGAVGGAGPGAAEGPALGGGCP